MQNRLLVPYSKGPLSLKNHLIMAPMTRCRAIGNIPNQLMADYYAQRAGAGLIITEGTAPTPDGLGYARIPGIFTADQVDGWKKVTKAVHARQSKIFVQLMHTGRIGHIDNLPEGAQLVGASSMPAAGQIYTDTKGPQDHAVPVALTTEGVKDVIGGHVTAARNAIEAGFDGVELHGANGYLLEQFLNPNTNTRTDEYGGSMEGRAKIVLDMTRAIAAGISKDKVGIRFSPYNTLGDLQAYDQDEVLKTYVYLAGALNEIGIAYIHIGRNPAAPPELLPAIRAAFHGTIILCNGFTPETAEAMLNPDGSGPGLVDYAAAGPRLVDIAAAGPRLADCVAFGRSFLANPDLDARIAKKASLNQPDPKTFFSPDAKGYTDYPVLSA